MVVGLLDTSIIVDLIRGYPDASSWLQSVNDDLGVTGYVWLEIIEGAPNKRKLKSSMAILSDFELVETNHDDIKWAIQFLPTVNLSHNVDAMDCLIAATAYRLQVPLYTRNLKHFKPLIGKLAQTPY